MWTGTPVKANTLDRAGGGQTSAPDFCIFASPLVLLPEDFCAENAHVGSHARKRQTPRAAQAAARLTSLIPASSSGPADREDFCGQCASDSRIWIAAVTSAEMVYHRAAPPLAEAGAFCRVSFSPAGFLYRKRTGPRAVTHRYKKWTMGNRNGSKEARRYSPGLLYCYRFSITTPPGSAGERKKPYLQVSNKARKG